MDPITNGRIGVSIETRKAELQEIIDELRNFRDPDEPELVLAHNRVIERLAKETRELDLVEDKVSAVPPCPIARETEPEYFEVY